MKKIILVITALLFSYFNSNILRAENTNSIFVRFKPNTDTTTIKEIFRKENITSYSQLLPNQAALTYKLNKGEKLLSFDSERLKKILKAEEPLLRTYEVEVSQKNNLEKYCYTLLKKYPEVEVAEPNYPNEPLEIPNDPLASSQTMLATIKAFSTWDSIKGDTNVIIGIVDTGVLQNHEDLSSSIAINWNEIPNNNIDDDGNGFVDDYLGCNLFYDLEGNGDNTYHPNSHGTSVAGIAGATTNNAKGMAGVAYKCRIFPIKASKLTSTGTIDNGYKGILYSAIRGCKVVNCSWGKVKPFSPIDQSIIDYAVARDVVVVAAGGNGKNSSDVYYPAGYSGVLAVGEVNQVDYVTTETTINETIRIMAPGVGNYVTLNSPSDYKVSTEGGTSYAAPVVTGVVAIARSLYPELDPYQTIEYVRQLSDDISEINPSYQYLIPGRINMHKMLEIAPFSIPGIKPIKYNFFHTDGTPDDRFNVGDTVVVRIDAHNYLGAAKNLRFVLSVADIFDNSLEVVDSESFIDKIETNSDFSIGPLSFKIKERNENRTLLRVDILGENSYKDFFLIPFLPTSYITTFENDSIKFSISDKGTLGFYTLRSTKFGEGVASKRLGNQLFKAGLMISEDSSKIVTALFGLNPDGSDFRTIKPFTNPGKNISIIDDGLASPLEKIGVEVRQFVYVPPLGEKFFKIYFKIKNISGKTIKNLSVGYYQDWDVGPSSDQNKSYLEPEAIPKTIIPIAAAAQFVESFDSSVVVGVGVVTRNSADQPQSAALNSEITASFARDKQILSLNSGTKLQYSGFDDIAIVSGMKFPGETAPGEEREFMMMIAIGSNREELKQIFLGNILQSNVENNEIAQQINIYPNPANDVIAFELPKGEYHTYNFQIVNCLGEIIKNGTLNKNWLEVSNLESGIYILKIYDNGKIYYQSFVKIK